MKYLWVHKKNPDESVLQIIEDPIELFKTGQLNEAFDKIYQIGQEVKVKLSIEQVTTYRSSGTATRSNAGLKGDLGVGEYRV